MIPHSFLNGFSFFSGLRRFLRRGKNCRSRSSSQRCLGAFAMDFCSDSTFGTLLKPMAQERLCIFRTKTCQKHSKTFFVFTFQVPWVFKYVAYVNAWVDDDTSTATQLTRVNHPKARKKHDKGGTFSMVVGQKKIPLKKSVGQVLGHRFLPTLQVLPVPTIYFSKNNLTIFVFLRLLAVSDSSNFCTKRVLIK